MSKGRKKIRFSGRDGDKLSFTKGDEPWTTVQAVSVHDAENLETWLNEKNTKRITLPERFRLDAAMRVLDSVDKMLAFYFWRTRIEQIVRNAVEGEPWLRGIDVAIVEGSIAAMRAFDDFANPKRGPRGDDLHYTDFPGLVLSSSGIPECVRNEIHEKIMHLTQKDLPETNLRIEVYRLICDLSEQAIHFCDYVLVDLSGWDVLRCSAETVRNNCQTARDSITEQL